MSPDRREPSLWPWVWISLTVMILGMACSPLLMLGMWTGTSPTTDALMMPVQPFWEIFQTVGLDNIFGFMLAVGLTYGLPTLAIGAVITGLRHMGRSSA